MNEVCIVCLEDKPYTELDGKIYFLDKEKAKNYRNNLVIHIGRRLYCQEYGVQNYLHHNGDWYEIGEERKQYWFKEADKKLSVKPTF